MSDALTYAAGSRNASDLLSVGGLRPVLRGGAGSGTADAGEALRLARDDPAAEVLACYPDAKADEAKAARWAGNWNAGVGATVRDVKNE